VALQLMPMASKASPHTANPKLMGERNVSVLLGLRASLNANDNTRNWVQNRIPVGGLATN